jgi:hypothetical protein
MKKQTDSTASRLVFMIARVIVGAFALLLCALGSGLCWAATAGELGWWGLALGLALFAGGLWFGWSAVKPHRENVANMSTDIVARILVELF